MTEAKKEEKKEEKKDNHISMYGSLVHLNGELLHSGNFVNKNVAIIGRYINSDPQSKCYTFASCDERRFLVHVDSFVFQGYNKNTIYQIIGHVTHDNLIAQETYEDWGANFGTSSWNKFVKLSHEFPNLF